jgi:succinoglycan biosynthesis protein ExoV
MDLFYYQDPLGNFGDDLNPYLWRQLLPELWDPQDGILFVGIGTLLNHRLSRVVPLAKRDVVLKVIFGAGVGYGEVPEVDPSWWVYAVRGPLSAQALGLEESLAITDAAILLTLLDLPQVQPHIPVAFMPHHKTARGFDWATACRQAGIHYLDPATGVEQNLQDIRSSKLVVAEAMHAAIVADAFRVPWIPLKLFGYILDFKWQDWCQSMGLAYAPVMMSDLASYFHPDADGVLRMNPERVAEGIRYLSQEREGLLSQASVLNLRLEQYQEKLTQLQQDYLALGEILT